MTTARIKKIHEARLRKAGGFPMSALESESYARQLLYTPGPVAPLVPFTLPERSMPTSECLDVNATIRDIRHELTVESRRRADLALGATLKVPPTKRVKKNAYAEVSARVYETSDGARKFGEGVVLGSLGSFITWVYFVGNDTTGPVKIGYSDDPIRRMMDLQVGHHEQLHLLCAISGDTTTEKMLHGVFAPDHVRGEWFMRSPQLVEFIRVITLGARKKPWDLAKPIAPLPKVKR